MVPESGQKETSSWHLEIQRPVGWISRSQLLFLAWKRNSLVVQRNFFVVWTKDKHIVMNSLPACRPNWALWAAPSDYICALETQSGWRSSLDIPPQVRLADKAHYHLQNTHVLLGNFELAIIRFVKATEKTSPSWLQMPSEQAISEPFCELGILLFSQSCPEEYPWSWFSRTPWNITFIEVKSRGTLVKRQQLSWEILAPFLFSPPSACPCCHRAIFP